MGGNGWVAKLPSLCGRHKWMTLKTLNTEDLINITFNYLVKIHQIFYVIFQTI